MSKQNSIQNRIENLSQLIATLKGLTNIDSYEKELLELKKQRTKEAQAMQISVKEYIKRMK